MPMAEAEHRIFVYDQDLEEEVDLDTFNIQQEAELDAALEIEDQIAGEMSVDTPDNGIGTDTHKINKIKRL